MYLLLTIDLFQQAHCEELEQELEQQADQARTHEQLITQMEANATSAKQQYSQLVEELDGKSARIVQVSEQNNNHWSRVREQGTDLCTHTPLVLIIE